MLVILKMYEISNFLTEHLSKQT